MISLFIDQYEIAPMERHHVDSMVGWGNHSESYLKDYNFTYRSKEELDRWYEVKTGPWNNRYFAIVREGLTIGYIGLKKIDFRYRVSDLGIVLNPDLVGLGIGTKILTIFLRHYFFDLGMSKLRLSVAMENKRALALYHAMGFKIRRDAWVTIYPEGTPEELAARKDLRKRFGRWQQRCHEMLLLRSDFVAMLRAKEEE